MEEIGVPSGRVPAADEKSTVAAHTPGPWHYRRGDSFDHSDDGVDNGFEILMGAGQYVHERIRYAEDIWPEDQAHKEAQANARLIASAPDLLEALKEIMGDVSVTNCMSAEQKKRARAAIARATAPVDAAGKQDGARHRAEYATKSDGA